MRILIYSHSFSPSVGGVETFVKRLASGLPRQFQAGKASITVVTNTPDNSADTRARVPYAVERQPGPIRLWRLVGESDVILLAGPALLPILFGLLRSKRLVVTHHGYQTVCPNGLLFHLPSQSLCPGHFRAKHYLECVRCCRLEGSLINAVLRVLLTIPRRILCSRVEHNIAVSEHLGNRIELVKTKVIRNGVPLTTEQELGKDYAEHSSRFVYIGRLVAEKGVDVLLRAARILRDSGLSFQVLIVGDGPERLTLERLCGQLGLAGNIEFLGFKSGEEVEKLLEQPFVSVVPSVWEDVAPFSPLEQMMAGKAIIAADIGGLAEEVGGAALKFPPGDSAALAGQMLKLIISPQFAVSLGEKARARARDLYSLEEMISRYAELLRSPRERLDDDS